MLYALTAIGLLALLAGLGWWFFATSQKLCGELAAENRMLRKGAEAHAAAERMPRQVVMDKVDRYSREIVPAFNAAINGA